MLSFGLLRTKTPRTLYIYHLNPTVEVNYRVPGLRHRGFLHFSS